MQFHYNDYRRKTLLVAHFTYTESFNCFKGELTRILVMCIEGYWIMYQLEYLNATVAVNAKVLV